MPFVIMGRKEPTEYYAVGQWTDNIDNAKLYGSKEEADVVIAAHNMNAEAVETGNSDVPDTQVQE